MRLWKMHEVYLLCNRFQDFEGHCDTHTQEIIQVIQNTDPVEFGYYC